MEFSRYLNSFEYMDLVGVKHSFLATVKVNINNSDNSDNRVISISVHIYKLYDNYNRDYYFTGLISDLITDDLKHNDIMPAERLLIDCLESGNIIPDIKYDKCN